MKATVLGWCDRGTEAAAPAASDGFYVSMGDGDRHALLAGPFDRLEHALGAVERVETVAEMFELVAPGISCAVCRAPTRQAGPLNARLGLAAG